MRRRARAASPIFGNAFCILLGVLMRENVEERKNIRIPARKIQCQKFSETPCKNIFSVLSWLQNYNFVNKLSACHELGWRKYCGGAGTPCPAAERREGVVIVRTPFRMSFAGGGTDFAEFFREHGGEVLSATIDRYCYVTVRHLPGFFEYRSEFCYSEIERVSGSSEIRHPLIREAVRMLDMQQIRLTYEADLPARSGLGTSSAFAVGMLNAFHCSRGEYASKRQLADEAIRLERELCQEAGGLQDQVAVSFGGLNRITFGENGYAVRPVIFTSARREMLNERLMLFFTGFSRFSFEIQEKTRDRLGDSTDSLLEMKGLVGDAERILTGGGGLSDFGRLLDYGWQLKRGVNSEISTDSVDMVYEKAKQAGALGGKLLGAGGGGFLLLYAEPERQEAVRQALAGLLYVPFRFEDSGTEVVYYAPDTRPF